MQRIHPYNLTHSNRRTQGPQSGHDSLREAQEAAQAWIASMGWVGEEMAALAGLEIRGPAGIEWQYRK